MAFINDQVADMLLELVGNGVDAVDDPDGDLIADPLLAVADDADFILRDAQEGFNSINPLVQEFPRMDYNEARLLSEGNQADGYDGLSAARGGLQGALVGLHHGGNSFVLERPKLPVEVERDVGEDSPTVYDLNVCFMLACQIYQRRHESPRDNEAAPVGMVKIQPFRKIPGPPSHLFRLDKSRIRKGQPGLDLPAKVGRGPDQKKVI